MNVPSEPTMHDGRPSLAEEVAPSESTMHTGLPSLAQQVGALETENTRLREQNAALMEAGEGLVDRLDAERFTNPTQAQRLETAAADIAALAAWRKAVGR